MTTGAPAMVGVDVGRVRAAFALLQNIATFF